MLIDDLLLKTTQARAIEYMADGNAALRIGHIWFGWDPGRDCGDHLTTVTGFATFSNKQVSQILPIRSESALAFASTTPPVDTITMEVVVHRSRWRDCIQELNAALLVSRILPVMNPVISMICMWSSPKTEVEMPPETLLADNPALYRRALMRLYAATPVMMDIMPITIETMPDRPEEIRLSITLRSVLSVNRAKERETYLATMDDVLLQHQAMKQIDNCTGDTPRMDAIGSIFGSNTSRIRNMINMIRRRATTGVSEDTSVQEKIRLIGYDVDRLMRGTLPGKTSATVLTLAGYMSARDATPSTIGKLVSKKIHNIAMVLSSALRQCNHNAIVVLHNVSGLGLGGEVATETANMLPVTPDNTYIGKRLSRYENIVFSSGAGLGSIVLNSLDGKTERISRSITALNCSITAARITTVSDMPDSAGNAIKKERTIIVVPLYCGGLSTERIISALNEVKNSFLFPDSDTVIALHADLSPIEWLAIDSSNIMSGWLDSMTYAFGIKGNYCSEDNQWELHDRFYLSPSMGNFSSGGGYEYSGSAGIPDPVPGEVNPATSVPVQFIGGTTGDGSGFSSHRPISTGLSWKIQEQATT